ncbi:transmembrane protein, putative (macronuclear) [Tetrahymena thermophila SB210]|uniref:Transmembrane protein, putative n=1 Tax=Tetrahymena thermophila (strain SB210) TaxID=312017 RepID=W7XA91_TETTS|nr:transmembrane protein, putative [Tetrahymena thermophila SB210]EWS74272.1 transmembrane protein, putative [Tetrahymena thermophila SB210]|eukprot:XP_012653187.1 transmembrane protein, putative [Tetrahymena thermophila SB210]
MINKLSQDLLQINHLQKMYINAQSQLLIILSKLLLVEILMVLILKFIIKLNLLRKLALKLILCTSHALIKILMPIQNAELVIKQTNSWLPLRISITKLFGLKFQLMMTKNVNGLMISISIAKEHKILLTIQKSLLIKKLVTFLPKKTGSKFMEINMVVLKHQIYIISTLSTTNIQMINLILKSSQITNLELLDLRP